MQIPDKIAGLRDKLKKKYAIVAKYMNPEEKTERLAELRDMTLDEGFWQNQEKAQSINREISAIEFEAERWKKVQQHVDDIDLYEMMFEEDNDVTGEFSELLEKLSGCLEDIENEKLLSGENDSRDAILEIRPGAGGTESMDWASMLYRMYTRWLDDKGYEYKVLNYLPGEIAGLKEAVLEIKGNFAFGYLNSESGVHRLVRISPFDSNARRHTSFASIFVYPIFDDAPEIEINSVDLRIDTFRASGAGGQHVNKTDSAIRLTHIPTNIVVSCQNERSQHKNKEFAMKMLHSRLYQKQQEEEKAKRNELDKSKMDNAWGSQIRSYVFQPYTMVKDTRSSYETGNIQAVMDGNLNPFINAFLAWKYQQENVENV